MDVSALQAVSLVLVAVAGTAVVLTRDPTRQVLVTGFFGLLLAILFLVFQAPDVALSQIVVGGVALPLMVLLTLAKLRQRDRERARDSTGDGASGSPTDRGRGRL